MSEDDEGEGMAWDDTSTVRVGDIDLTFFRVNTPVKVSREVDLKYPEPLDYLRIRVAKWLAGIKS